MAYTQTKLDGREAIYTLKRQPVDFERLSKALSPANNEVVTFYIAKEGNLFSVTKRIFSIRDLHAKYWERRKKRSLLMATTPKKDKGFFIPWDPHYQTKNSEVVQIIHRGDLIFENSILIKKLRLEKTSLKNANRY